MKKIIAAAVASAFIAPAFAVEFGGEIEYVFVDQDSVANRIDNDTVEFVVSHTIETDAGVEVTGTYTFENDAGAVANDGGRLAFAGAFGELQIGDAAGALDAIDGAAEFTPLSSSIAEIGSDHSVAYTAPVVSGLTIRASMSPETAMESTTADETAYSASYSLEGLTVSYGSEKQADAVDFTLTTLRYSMGGASFAYATGEQEGETTNLDVTSMAASYSIDAFTFGIQQDEGDTNGTVDSDVRYLFAEYGVADGLNVYVESTDDKQDATNDQTAVGVQFSF